MPRCCNKISGEFAPCYASVLVGDLERKVDSLEKAPIAPCLTAWCSTCHTAYLITSALPVFPCPSAHHAHMVVLASTLRQDVRGGQGGRV